MTDLRSRILSHAEKVKRLEEMEATLAGALEQQAYRKMYVSITRARYRVLAVISPNASPTLILREAEKAGRITSHLQ